MNEPAKTEIQQPPINDVVSKYIELRDRQTVIAERHKQELKPLQEGMEAIERYLMDQMNSLGVDSLPCAAGTPYKAVSRSVKMQDPQAFKEFVFKTAIDHISGMMGEDYQNLVKQTLFEDIKWDMIDFRAGKKGLVELFEENKDLVPASIGISFDQFVTVNIRRR